MSLLTEKQIDTMVEVDADSLSRFLAARVPLKTLLGHGLHGLTWLSENAGLAFHFTYRDAAGELRHEQVDAIGAIERGHELGFEPSIAGEHECFSFLNAFVWREENADEELVGVWFSQDTGDCTEDEYDLPLSLPPERLQAELRVRRAASQAWWEQHEADRAAAQKKRERDSREGLAYLIQSTINRHGKLGRVLTQAEAEAEVRDMLQRMAEKTGLRTGLVEDLAILAGPSLSEAA